MGDLVPRKEMVNQGVKGVGGVAGGVALLIVKGLLFSLGLVPGLIIGGVLTLGGLAISRSKGERTAGAVVAGAGILTLVASTGIGAGLAGALMTIGGIGLLAFGGYSLIKFILNLRKRR